MKKIIESLCIFGTVILLAGCKENRVEVDLTNFTQQEEIVEEQLIDEEEQKLMDARDKRIEEYKRIGGKEYLKKYYNFDEAELDGYDADAFVEDWVVCFLEEPTLDRLSRVWEDRKEEYKLTEDYLIYGMLKKDSERKLTKEDHVVKIQVFSQVGNEPGHSVVADVEKGVFYVDDTTPHAMDDMMKMRLKDITNQYDVESWQSSYECYDDSTAYVGWEVRFLLDTGEVCVYSGGGASFSGFHDEIMEIVGCYRDLLDSVGIRG